MDGPGPRGEGRGSLRRGDGRAAQVRVGVVVVVVGVTRLVGAGACGPDASPGCACRGRALRGREVTRGVCSCVWSCGGRGVEGGRLPVAVFGVRVRVGLSVALCVGSV